MIRCSAAAVPPNCPLPPWKQRFPQPVWAAWPQPQRMLLWCQTRQSRRSTAAARCGWLSRSGGDPWLNGRLTALHACSDLWACGASVSRPKRYHSAPGPQHSATVVGPDHRWNPLRARSPASGTDRWAHLEERNRPQPCSRPAAGPQRAGSLRKAWPKRGLQAGDQLLLGRPSAQACCSRRPWQSHQLKISTLPTQMQTGQHPRGQ